MMISAMNEEIISQPEVEPDLDQRMQKVQGLFKFKSFYDQMDFNSEQILAIRKAIIELTDYSKSLNLDEKKPRRNSRFEDNALVFYENNSKDVPTQYNLPLYIIVKVRDIELKRVLLDAGTSLDIISLNVLDDNGIPRENIQKQPFEVSSFNGNRTYTIGLISSISQWV